MKNRTGFPAAITMALATAVAAFASDTPAEPGGAPNYEVIVDVSPAFSLPEALVTNLTTETMTLQVPGSLSRLDK